MTQHIVIHLTFTADNSLRCTTSSSALAENC